MEHPFLAGFTRALNEGAVATLRFNFPYREAGRKFPDRPPAAIATWRAAMDAAAVSRPRARQAKLVEQRMGYLVNLGRVAGAAPRRRGAPISCLMVRRAEWWV